MVAFHITTKDIPNWFWTTFEHVENPKLQTVQQIPTLADRDKYGFVNGKISNALEKDFKENNMPSYWKYYRLRGTQNDFASSKGVPSILANTYIENNFLESSSCITCHSRASTGSLLAFEELPHNMQDGIKNGTPKVDGVDPRHYYNQLDFIKEEISPRPITNDIWVAYTGYPDPTWFEVTYSPTNRKDTYKQLDFMWSMTRAKRLHPYTAK